MRHNPYLGWYPWPDAAPPRYDYAETLRTLNELPRKAGPWAFVRNTERVQGWKLHLSSINVEACSLLQVVVPYLQNTAAPFKVARDSRILSQLNDGLLGMAQVGKFLTIYPQSDEIAEAMAEWLIEHTRSYVGPTIITDLHVGGIVYARFGSFHPRVIHDRLGRSFRAILDSDGKLVPDKYQIPFVPNGPGSCPFAHVGPIEQRPRKAATPRLLGGRYLLADVLNRRPKGSIFLAIDLASPTEPRLKVIKEGKPYCESDDFGRDVRSRLKHEHTVHRALNGRVRTPVADSYFEEEERGYLPLEYIPWDDVRSLAEHPWCSLTRDKQVSVLGTLLDLITEVRSLHELGYVHRDLSPSNIFLHQGRIHLTDYDLTHHVGDLAPPFQGGTPGFASPQQFAGHHAAFCDDVYALGCDMLYLLAGVHPRLIIADGGEDRYGKLLRLFGGVSKLASIVNRCINESARRRPTLTTVAEEIQDSQSSR